MGQKNEEYFTNATDLIFVNTTHNGNFNTNNNKQLTKIRKSFWQNSVTPNSSKFADKFKTQLEPVHVNSYECVFHISFYSLQCPLKFSLEYLSPNFQETP